MKSTHVALFATLGMMFTSVSVYSLAPPGGRTSAPRGGDVAVAESSVVVRQIAGDGPPVTELSRFTAGSRLLLEGRVGHPRLPRSARETFLMFEVRGDGSSARTQAQASLSLVIDRSGSMKGTRLVNAIQAATRAIERLNDGDLVSVVAFDTRPELVVPPTVVSRDQRPRILAGIRSIALGGDTCISCGIDEGLGLLDAAATSGRVTRMLVLSDGDANHGIRDIAGFRSLAQRARDRGVSITTIGVDVDYNEKILAAIAQESNGGHYFVENDAALTGIFEAEAERLSATIASGAELAIDLAPGVELDRVFDRSFRRVGSRILVPLGAFTAGDTKSVLLKVRLNGTADGVSPLADADMAYRDLVAGADARCAGKLGVVITSDPADASDIDAVVAGRVQRSETSTALQQASSLFEQGRIDDARRKLDEQQRALENVAEKAKRLAPAGRGKEIESDFEGQRSALQSASSDFSAPREFATPPSANGAGTGAAAPSPQASRAGKSAIRRNETNIVDLAR